MPRGSQRRRPPPIRTKPSDPIVIRPAIRTPAVAARNHPDDPASELRLLLVHGILHLLGHDHMERADRASMWARQERYSGVRVK